MKMNKILFLTLFLCIFFYNSCYAELKIVDSGQVLSSYDSHVYESITFKVDTPLYKKFKVQWYYDRMNNTLYAYSAFGKNPLYKTYIPNINGDVNILIYELYDESTQKVFFALKEESNKGFFYILGFNGKGEYLEQLYNFRNDFYNLKEDEGYNITLSNDGLIYIFKIYSKDGIRYIYKLEWNDRKFVFDVKPLKKEKFELKEYKPHKFNWYTVYKD